MSPFAWFETPWGPALRCEVLEPYARHVFTTRGLDLPHADEGSGWTTLAAWLGVESSHLWRLRQVHGLTVHTEAVAPCDGAWPEGDLLATDRHDVALAVRTADCVPILYADPRTGAVAAVHAGWRGTVAGAASRMVEVLATRFGSRPEDLIAAIGPCVGPESYEVGQEVIDAFAAAWPSAADRGTWWVTRSHAWQVSARSLDHHARSTRGRASASGQHPPGGAVHRDARVGAALVSHTTAPRPAGWLPPSGRRHRWPDHSPEGSVGRRRCRARPSSFGPRPS